MKKSKIIVMLAALWATFVLLTGCFGGAGDGSVTDGQGAPGDGAAEIQMEEADFSMYFNGMEGAAVLISDSGKTTVYNPEAAATGASPCSTFKILSTLMILETGVVEPEEKLLWDGTGWRFEAWNQDIALKEAFQSSCVWYYRQAIDRIGGDYIQNRLDHLGYGNGDISQWEGSGFNGIATADGFWLESSLLISPLQQAQVLQRLFRDGGAEPEHLDALKDIMEDHTFDGAGTLYGKTGSGRGGWYVGFWESGRPAPSGQPEEGTTVYFAVRLGDQEGASGAAAKEIAVRILTQENP